MKPNYRVIAIDTTNGQLFDIAEFVNFADALNWLTSGRFMGNVHTFIVDISAADPSMHSVMNI